MGKKMNFKSLDSLEQVTKILNEAGEALKDSTRTIATSAIPDILGAALGAVGGGAVSLAALIAGGSVAGLSAAGITSGLAAAGSIVGGGMVAGIGVLAAPVAILAVGGYAVVSGIKHQKLRQEKERLYQLALQKHDAIIRALDKKLDLSEERAKYLNSLNILLQSAIRDLQADLAA